MKNMQVAKEIIVLRTKTIPKNLVALQQDRNKQRPTCQMKRKALTWIGHSSP